MKFASVRIVTNHLDRLASFYTLITGVAPTRLHPQFSEIRLEGAVLAISTTEPVKRFNVGAAVPEANQSAIFEFQVDDVDSVYKRLGGEVQCVMEPTNMPWGNRSLLLRDPDGNLVNIFSKNGATY